MARSTPAQNPLGFANLISLFKNLGKSYSLPIPLMNIINGGAHADNDLNIQEWN